MQIRTGHVVPVDLRRDETRLRRIRSAFDRGDCVSSEPDGCCSAEECTTFLAVGWASGWLVNADLTGRRVSVCDGVPSALWANSRSLRGLPAIEAQPATPATTRDADISKEATRRWRRADRRLSGLPGLPTSTK